MKLVDAEFKYAIGHYRTNYGLLDAEIISLENSFTDEEKFITSFVGGSTSDIVTLNVSGTVMATKR